MFMSVIVNMSFNFLFYSQPSTEETKPHATLAAGFSTGSRSGSGHELPAQSHTCYAPQGPEASKHPAGRRASCQGESPAALW